MADVQIKELHSLSLEKIKKYLPSNCKITSLAEAEIGKQEKNTVVIGEFHEIQRRRTLLAEEQPPIRLLLKEVIPDNSIGLCFYVVIYGKTINLVEKALESKGNDALWIGFSNLSLMKYTGQEEIWCPYDLRIDDEENDNNKKIILLYHRKKPKELPIHYESLNNIKHKEHINVFVAVHSLIKQPVVLNNKSTHLMINLIDQSCLEKGAQYKDIPLHIFLNQHLDNFPTSFATGDILRIRGLLGDFYAKDNRMFGIIYNSGAVVKFRLREDDNKVTPISSNLSYVLTAQDEKIVRNLRQWWIENMEKKEKKICEITSPCTFNINCLIKDVFVNEVHNIAILRVTDKTKSNVMITINFNDAVELQTKEEKIARAHHDLDEIHITVFEPLLKKVSDLKRGDIVQLRNVTCENLVDGEEYSDPVILDFFMKDDNCEICVILQQSSALGQLIWSLIGTPNANESYGALHTDEKESDKKYSSNGESKTLLPLRHFGDEEVIEQSITSPSSSGQFVNRNNVLKDKEKKRKVGHYFQPCLYKNSRKMVSSYTCEHKQHNASD